MCVIDRIQEMQAVKKFVKIILKEIISFTVLKKLPVQEKQFKKNELKFFSNIWMLTN